jgi:hypothetical protein
MVGIRISGTEPSDSTIRNSCNFASFFSDRKSVCRQGYECISWRYQTFKYVSCSHDFQHFHTIAMSRFKQYKEVGPGNK